MKYFSAKAIRALNCFILGFLFYLHLFVKRLFCNYRFTLFRNKSKII